MLHKLRFNQAFRCFKQGEIFEFRPGVNLLVGDQGAGKSTMFQVIVSCSRGKKPIADVGTLADEGTSLFSFDFEKENPRMQDMRTNSRPCTFNVATRFSSHGQTVNAIVAEIDKQRDTTLLMDEPDMALSVRSVAVLAEKFRRSAEAGNQLIAAVHNPLLIQAFPEVYSIEHRRWMDSREFVDLLWRSGCATN